MLKTHINEYYTVGSRLARQITSPNGYFDAERGVADINQAAIDFIFFSHSSSFGYQVERKSKETIDVLNGPDFIVISKNPNTNDHNSPELAYVYECLDENQDLNNCNSPQATIYFDDLACSNKDNHTFRNTMKLIMMKLNYDAYIQDYNPEMILGIHKILLDDHPEFANVIEESGFLKDERNIDKNGLTLYHLGTKYTGLRL